MLGVEHIKRAKLALLLVLFPLTSHADVGSLGGVVATAFTMFATLWGTLTLFMFLLLGRKLALGKRLGWTALFLLSPVLLLGLALLAAYALGEGITDKTEITREPVMVYGVTFPPGSQIDYEQTGGFFGWHAERTWQHIRSSHPVPLGNIHIDGFIFMPQNRGNTIRLLLSAGQTIDGWPCGDTTVNIEQGKPILLSCFLTAPRMRHGQLMPAGAYITADGG
ncbi:hypothetical protein Q3O98_19905 [Ralstonia pseudosolanacearum]|uniref:hypothetical protein n=1 Tax=Ralstonia pseudosolanacearum TaxID=1310165 RepID=UPI00267484D1|nr:hypothetical protein [Ralstonia pseudosolanacearum]MDO3623344.1 hypothetical protein [Ralstonia pseudosolanacearum]